MPGKADDAPIVIGKLIGAHGVRGWLKVYSWTQPRENILRYDPWLLRRGGEWRSVRLLDGRKQGKSIVARLDGVDDRDEALALREVEVAIRPDQLEALEEGEYYWSELIGLQVRNLGGETLGEVTNLMETGADDVLVVRGEVERLIPFSLPEIVRRVDLDAGEIIVDWEPDYLQEE